MEVSKRGGMKMERDFAGRDRPTVQCAEDVSLSCTLETWMALSSGVTPINSIKKKKKKGPKKN